MTELILNFLIADDPCGTHKGFLRTAVLKMDALRLITHFEAGKVQLNLLFMSNFFFYMWKFFPFLIYLPARRTSLSDG